MYYRIINWASIKQGQEPLFQTKSRIKLESSNLNNIETIIKIIIIRIHIGNRFNFSETKGHFGLICSVVRLFANLCIPPEVILDELQRIQT
jgi:hypothetical protein